MSYDLEERTAVFGENAVILCKKAYKSELARPIVNQLIRLATSVGANYLEANGASSKKDFRNKIFICKKEAQETRHWLRMLAKIDEDNKDEMRKLWQESRELSMIFSKICSTIDNKK